MFTLSLILVHKQLHNIYKYIFNTMSKVPLRMCLTDLCDFLAGHGDYAYQQSSYTEQSYDRSFDDSTQHYYEGGRKT